MLRRMFQIGASQFASMQHGSRGVMRTVQLAVVCVGLMVVAAGQVQAGTILYFSDFTLGTDRMAQALANRVAGGDSVTTVSSAAAFQAQLTGGGYDLGIFMVQGSSGYASAINSLGTFAIGGGKSIYADWSRNTGLAAQFGASFTGNTNQTQMTITDPSLLAGLANPINLINPGWGVFSTGLSGGVSAATFVGNGESAITIGNSGRSIVNGFLTDTFSNGAEGVRLYENQIGYLLDTTAPVPEPASLAVFGIAACVAGFGAVRRRRSEKLQAATA